MAGLHHELFGHGDTDPNAANMFAFHEIQAALAKEAFDHNMACRPRPLKCCSGGPKVAPESVIGGADGDILDRFRSPTKGYHYFFTVDLSEPGALDGLRELLGEMVLSPLLPPPKTEHDWVQQPKPKGGVSEVPMLKVSSMDYTNVDDVCLALKTNTTFLKIDMSANKIEADTISPIADLLCENNTITWLNLSSNDLHNEGVEILATAVKECMSLKFLDLGLVNIGLQGTKSLRSMLEENMSLTHLVLSGNTMIGTQGVEQICLGLQKNRTIAHLDLANVGCGAPGAELLLDLVKANHSITELNLEGNKIDDHLMEAIMEQLQTNYSHCFTKEMEQSAQYRMQAWNKS